MVKKKSYHLPFVAPSAASSYGRCVFRSFRGVCICKLWNEFRNPRENGLIQWQRRKSTNVEASWKLRIPSLSYTVSGHSKGNVMI